ncbi:uncharacterized protein LOC110986724 isoform X2 [Acanthaster planci]|uniref:Uncharacterized protein LOC110986724 isoform X2 n=1 Tax=Acanthaster planci TaxID=133434 RepID=A0A8B7ZMH9_ACAPL|nr:uncharacterized protein LOC110986724 isoform X2 [Acanthaster planci]
MMAQTLCAVGRFCMKCPPETAKLTRGTSWTIGLQRLPHVHRVIHTKCMVLCGCLVCSMHFPDGRPTAQNPYPVLHMKHDVHVTPSAKVSAATDTKSLSSVYATGTTVNFAHSQVAAALAPTVELAQRAVTVILKQTASKTERSLPENRDKSKHTPSSYSYDGACTSLAKSQGLQAVHCDHNYVDHRTMEEKLNDADQRIRHLEGVLEVQQMTRFGTERITSDPQLLKFYTGFPDCETFMAAFKTLEPTADMVMRWRQAGVSDGCQGGRQPDVFKNESLPLLDQFFLFLCRVKVGLFEQDLAVRFNISLSTVSRIAVAWAHFLYFALRSLPIWPTQRAVRLHMPMCIRMTYPNTRVILECAEVKVQGLPCPMGAPLEPSPNDKDLTTAKGLVGITPCGAVSFVSDLYTGSTSDKAITKMSGILENLEGGDQVLMATSFPIDDVLQNIGCSLVVPPFHRKQYHLDSLKVSPAVQMARLQTHLAQAIQRVKEFHILDSVIPSSLAGSANQLWTVCCLLTNFKRPLL